MPEGGSAGAAAQGCLCCLVYGNRAALLTSAKSHRWCAQAITHSVWLRFFSPLSLFIPTFLKDHPPSPVNVLVISLSPNYYDGFSKTKRKHSQWLSRDSQIILGTRELTPVGALWLNLPGVMGILSCALPSWMSLSIFHIHCWIHIFYFPENVMTLLFLHSMCQQYQPGICCVHSDLSLNLFFLFVALASQLHPYLVRDIHQRCICAHFHSHIHPPGVEVPSYSQ